ncbi:hypothetical protein [Brevibacillus sp. AY1]|uniref:hypothetical protein n=1 Tax=Brevibacillus sp. AY1 TaxID=2807621 RepID=UPI002453C158|nr:hypothetical protein [Brevibacillus sp. AY1]MDH4616477.1 hypothetical protein [Brevibacillus sp. AY1]
MNRIWTLILLALMIGLSACSQSQEEKLLEYLDESTSYNIISEFNNGVLNIEIPLLDEEKTWSQDGELHIQLETKILLDAVKKSPRKELNLFEEVNLHYITKETSKIVAEIQVKGSTLMDTDWENLDTNEVPKYVDHYTFKGNK